MASKYQTVSHPNIAGGVDRRSAYNNIPQGFAEDILNMDTNSTGYVHKRKGYQRYAGDLPLRVTKITGDGIQSTYEIHFDPSVNLLGVSSSPIVLQGLVDFAAEGSTVGDEIQVVTTVSIEYLEIGDKVTNDLLESRVVTDIVRGDPFSTVTVNEPFLEAGTYFTYTKEVEIYWPEFTKAVPQTFLPLSDPNVMTQVHSYGTPKGMVRIAKTTSTIDGSVDNSWIESNSVVIDSDEMTVSLTRGSDPDPITLYIFNDQKEIEGRESYFATGSDTPDAGIVTINIPLATHNFTNLNIIPELYATVDSYSTIYRIIPESVEIKDNGDIEIKVIPAAVDLDGGDLYWSIQIHALPPANSIEVEITPTTEYIEFENVSSPLNFTSIFIRDLAEGTGEFLILPEEVEYDDENSKIRVKVNVTTNVVAHLTYMEGFLSANTIMVDDSFKFNTVDLINNVQASVYGIPQENILYEDRDSAGGNINCLTEYSSEGQNALIAGMGGVLFKEQLTSTTNFTLPSSYVFIRRRVAEKKKIGPFFGAPLSEFRDRWIHASNIVDNKAVVSKIENSGTETAVVYLDLPDKGGLLSGLVTVNQGITNNNSGNDKLTITSAGTPWYIGVFDIIDTDDAENTITISIPNLPAYISDELDVGGVAYIDTDFVILKDMADGEIIASDPNFIVGDVIESSAFENSPVITGLSIPAIGTEYILFMSGLVEEASVPALMNITGTRTSSRIPVVSVSNMVIGDVVRINGYNRKFAILDIDTSNKEITIDEAITIKDISSIDRTLISVMGRWKSIESPDSPIINNSTIDYFDEESYAQKSRLWAASLNDSLYFSDYKNEVMKFDGANIYRAGLPNWQPRCHSWVDTSQEKIAIPTYAALQASVVDGNTVLTFGYEEDVPDMTGVNEIYIYSANDGAGDTITAQYATVVEVSSLEIILEGSSIITVGGGGDGIISGSLVKFSIPMEVAYYFKLQLYDRNNNIIATSVTDYQECTIPLVKSGIITHKLTGMPKFDVYDYDRIDLMVYRTAIAKTVTPVFYQIQRLPIDYETINGRKHIIITDSNSNDIIPIGSISNDRASVALKGAEQPLSTEQPPRAKYITSAANRLILGNIKSYDQCEIFMDNESKTDEDNVLDETVIKIENQENELTFKFVPALNADYVLEIDSIDFTTDTDSFTLTLTDTVATSLTGKYIQIDSFEVDNTSTSVDNELGKLIGWWKVADHTATQDTVTINYTHGLIADWVSTNNLMYAGFVEADNSIPVIAHPYSPFPTGTIVTKLVYRDTKNILDYTSAIDRGFRDLKRAFNQLQVDSDTPWALAQAGVTEGTGTLVLKSVKAEQQLAVTITVGTTGIDSQIFVNQLKTKSGQTAQGITYVYPSRLIISKENYPEMIDAPFAISAIYSDSVVDINADDGQEITGFSTFFGSSSTTDSQLESNLIVFKNRSVYAVNLITKQQRKLESMEQGCTIPASISPVKNGIMFANNSGLYQVNRDLTVEYSGQLIEDYWNSSVNKATAIEQAVGFTDSTNRKYKLSIPFKNEEKNDSVIVFDYIGGKQQELNGAWTFYDNFPATGWVQTNTGVFFSGYRGRIYSLRDLGEATDFRDDAEAIYSSFTYAPTSFGDNGTRVALSKIITHLKAVTDLTDARVYIAVDMENTFEESGTLSFDMSEAGAKKLYSIASSLPDSHCLFVQIKYTHNTIDEDFVIAGIEYKAMPLSELGIPQTIKGA